MLQNIIIECMQDLAELSNVSILLSNRIASAKYMAKGARFQEQKWVNNVFTFTYFDSNCVCDSFWKEIRDAL